MVRVVSSSRLVVALVPGVAVRIDRSVFDLQDGAVGQHADHRARQPGSSAEVEVIGGDDNVVTDAEARRSDGWRGSSREQACRRKGQQGEGESEMYGAPAQTRNIHG